MLEGHGDGLCWVVKWRRCDGDVCFVLCVCVVVCRMEQNLVILSTNGVLGQKGKGKGERMSPAVPFSCVWKIASPFLDSGLCPLILLPMCEEEVRRGEFDRKEFARDL